MGGDDSVVGSRAPRQNYSERGLYAKAIRDAIDAMRRDDPGGSHHLARAALKNNLVRSVPTWRPWRSTPASTSRT